MNWLDIEYQTQIVQGDLKWFIKRSSQFSEKILPKWLCCLFGQYMFESEEVEDNLCTFRNTAYCMILHLYFMLLYLHHFCMFRVMENFRIRSRKQSPTSLIIFVMVSSTPWLLCMLPFLRYTPYLAFTPNKWERLTKICNKIRYEVNHNEIFRHLRYYILIDLLSYSGKLLFDWNS